MRYGLADVDASDNVKHELHSYFGVDLQEFILVSLSNEAELDVAVRNDSGKMTMALKSLSSLLESLRIHQQVSSVPVFYLSRLPGCNDHIIKGMCAFD